MRIGSGVTNAGSVKIMDGSGSTGTTTIGRNDAIKIVNSASTTVDISATGLLTLRGSSINTFGDVSLNSMLFVGGDVSMNSKLFVSGLTTLGSATFTNNSPAYEIEYPVNSGHIDFYANSAEGVRTRGGKIDASGVYTISKFDTIDETAGILNIGTAAARTGNINIGTDMTEGSIKIGNNSSGTSSTNTTITANITTGIISIGNYDICNNQFRAKSSVTIAGFTSANTTGDLRIGQNMTSGTHQYSHNQTSGTVHNRVFKSKLGKHSHR